jgi:hypothetical protein
MLHQVCEQAEGATLTFLLHRMSPLLAHSVALNPFYRGLLIGAKADSNAAAR